MRRSWLIPAVIALIAGGSAAPASAQIDITGRLVDTTCYINLGRQAASEADLVKCSVTGAQKNQRLALVTETGAVYLVKGLLTDENNKRLVSLINRPVIVTGVVTAGDPATDSSLSGDTSLIVSGDPTTEVSTDLTAVGGDLEAAAAKVKPPLPGGTVEPEPDTRRRPRRDNEIIETTVKTGDFREGDPKTGAATTIDALSILDVVNNIRVQ